MMKRVTFSIALPSLLKPIVSEISNFDFSIQSISIVVAGCLADVNVV